MHHSTKRRVVLGMTTGGLLLTGMGMAQADASADGAAAHSPGLLSGDLIQAPIDAPINVCGNVVDVLGVLNSAADNRCGNADGNASTAQGVAKDSPGIVSGNLVQAPLDIPVNVCGNSVSGVGVGNVAFGNTCSNGDSHGTNRTSDASANGGSHDSAGLGSGNTVQVPINAPVNACGNSISGVGIGDIAFGNTCSNGDVLRPPSPPVHPGPPTCGCHSPSTSAPSAPTTHGRSGSLAETGTDVGNVMAPLSASMLGGGGLLLRKRATSLRHLSGRQH